MLMKKIPNLKKGIKSLFEPKDRGHSPEAKYQISSRHSTIISVDLELKEKNTSLLMTV